MSLDIIRFLFVGLGAGFCSGIFGIGGGIVLIPLLVLFFGFSQHAANGTSLVALLLPVGALGVLAYYQAGKISSVHIKAGFVVALGIFAGTYLGARFSLALSEAVLRRAFGVFLLALSVRFCFFP